MNDRVFNIIATVAKRGSGGVSIEELKARADEQGLWDSLLHVELVFALEAEFDIFFSQEEIAQIDTPAKVLDAVNLKVSSSEA